MKKIAVPTKGNSIDDHFGNCEGFTLYTIGNDNTILEKQAYPSPKSCGCKSNLGAELKEEGITVLLAAGIGQGAINKLKQQEMEVYSGYKGEADQVVKDYLAGKKGNFMVCHEHDDCNH